MSKAAALTLTAWFVLISGWQPASAAEDIGVEGFGPGVTVTGEDYNEDVYGPPSGPRTPSVSGPPEVTPFVPCTISSSTPPIPVCGLKADQEAAEGSTVTVGDLRRAVREVPMPKASLSAEPPGGTLIGVPAIFHTTTGTFRTSVTLLGHQVDLHAEPSRYTWHHGDGTSQTSSGPGRPYPAKDVTHEYRRVADDLAASVDVTYSVRYRVDGGPWLDLDAPLTATGPVTRLDVDEAAPVLTGS